ncbi:hypothetical protein OBBRIDRAFT_725005, partial [Obba rivulosa]
LAASAGINGGIIGATFFSFREYLVSPMLTSLLWDTAYARRLRALQDARAAGPQVDQKLTYWDMRLHKVPDTFISGVFTGGVFNAWTHGRKTVVPGMLTVSVVCTVLQLAYNEFNIARIKYVSRKTEKVQASNSGGSEGQPQKTFTNRAMGWLGLRPMSDEEYIAVLERQRNGYLHRIEELEAEQAAMLEKPAESASQPLNTGA